MGIEKARPKGFAWNPIQFARSKVPGGASAAVAATAVAGGSGWAALAGASLAIGRSAVTFGTMLIDGFNERRKENYEVAYIHEIKKRLGSP